MSIPNGFILCKQYFQNMFESKLNMSTKQKSAERKVFLLFTEKVIKIGNIKGSNTNLKFYFAFVNYQTQRILHPCEGRCQ